MKNTHAFELKNWGGQ